MYYRHNLDYDYPERSDHHMITVKQVRKLNLDENYPYYQGGAWFRFKRIFLWLFLNLIVFWVCRFRYGLKIYGRRNLKENKEILRNGAITISNHVVMWDNICIMRAIRPRLNYVAVWKDNVEGPNGTVIRWAGGIPVPDSGFRSMAAFNRAVERVLEEGRWLHFFPEGSMWFYYPDVRPFKKAIFNYAAKYQKPIVPVAFSFRPRRGIMKLFSKNPCIDMTIGKPLIPDKELPLLEASKKLHKEAYHVMQVMCGINPGDKTYNENQDIDSYVKTM